MLFRSCSFGATAWHPGTFVTEESLIRVSDEALYGAKRAGRNRVVYLPYGDLSLEATGEAQRPEALRK